MSKPITKEQLRKRIEELEKELESLKWKSGSEKRSSIKQTKIKEVEEDLLSSLSDGILVLDRNLVITFVNQSSADQLGHSSEELTGSRILDFIKSSSGKADYEKILKSALKDDLPESGEYRVSLENGKKLHLYMNFSVRRHPGKKSRQLIIIHRDIRLQKEMEESLVEREKQLNAMIENFPDHILNVDHNGKILFVNNRRLTFNSSEIVNRTVFDFTLPEDHKKIKDEIRRVFLTGEDGYYESSGIGRDGIVRWYSTSLAPLRHDDGVIAVTLCARDISNKKAAEDQLLESNHLLESVFGSIPGVLAVLDRNLNIVHCNRGEEIHRNRSRSGARRKCYEVYRKRKQQCEDCHVIGVFNTGKPVWVEKYNEEDNNLKEVRSYPIFDESGSVKYVVEHVQDDGWQKQSRENRPIVDNKTESAMEMKSEFLSKISHELKTPMIGILGFSKLGMERYATAKREKLKSYFETIRESGEKLQEIQNNLLDLSQLEVDAMDYSFQDEKLSTVTTIILNELFTTASKKELVLDFRRPDFSDYVSMDVDKIGKVVKNLVSNAIKHSPQQGVIRIEILRKKRDVLFSVYDNGAGLSENDKESIFNKTSDGGRSIDKNSSMGIGLAISRKIISDHKGEIWANNNTPDGSVFSFTLPGCPV